MADFAGVAVTVTVLSVSGTELTDPQPIGECVATFKEWVLETPRSYPVIPSDKVVIFTG